MCKYTIILNSRQIKTLFFDVCRIIYFCYITLIFDLLAYFLMLLCLVFCLNNVVFWQFFMLYYIYGRWAWCQDGPVKTLSDS